MCVNAAGDIACRGEQAPGEDWSIGILNPYDTQQVVEVGARSATARSPPAASTSAASTSATRATGTTDVHYDSATVVGPDAGLADALATACLLEGPGCAAWFADLPGWSVYLIKDGQASYFGPAFAHL